MKKMKKSLLICLMTLIAALCLALAACGGGGITFKFVTGEGAPFVPDAHPEAGTEYTLPTPEWEGHSFEGWYSDSEFSGSPVTSQMAEENTTFYAKWETMYRVTLDVAGGTLDTDGFYLKAGDNLGEAVKSYIPTKTGFEFGEWLNGKTALSANAKMPSEDVTLTAHYKVGYTVEVYLQDKDDAAKYTKSENYTGYAYADGRAFTPDYAPEGYEAMAHDGEVISLTLDESDPSKNVFKIYYDVLQVTVHFLANDPEQPNLSASRSGKYGGKIDLPTEEFTREGYLLVGWSEYTDGSDMIPVTHKASNVAEFTPAQYELKEDITLFAVWKQGNIDIFGGGDYIYVVDDGIYLERAGFLFAGQKRGNENLYTFSAEGKIILTCKVFEDGTFCYADDEREGYSAKLYDVFTGELNDGVTMVFDDSYNGLRYIVQDEDTIATVTYSGSYSLDEEGYFHTHFTSASSGNVIEDFVFMRALVSDETGNQISVFVIRNEEDCALGVLTMYIASPEGPVPDEDDYQLQLNGFGEATLNYQGYAETMYYIYDVESFGFEILALYTSDGQLFGTFVVDTFSGVNGYMYFDTEAYGTFEEEEGTGKLDLDGLGNATFTKDGNTVTGYYETDETVSGDTLVYVLSGEDILVFAIDVSYSVDEESGEYIYEYSYVQYADYGEYYYATEDGYGYPLMITGVTENEFVLYVPDSEEMYMYPVATGTLSLQDGVYTATVEENIETTDGLADMDIDFTKLKEFVFSVVLTQDSSGYITLMSWSSYTLEGDEQPHSLGTTYHAKDGADKGTLVVTNVTATYTDEKGTVYTGMFGDEELFYYLSVDADTVFYFALDKEASTYQLLDASKLNFIYEISEDGSADGSAFIFYDGLGGTFYCVADPTTGTYNKQACTVTDTEKTTMQPFEDKIYSFTCGDTTFKFITITDGTYSYFIKELKGFSGTYTAKNGDTLALDGFSYAVYNTNNSPIYGYYSLEETSDGKTCVLFMDLQGSDFYCYIDVTETDTDKSFTVRGDEFLDCLLMDNNRFNGEFLFFDGYGKLTVYTSEEDDAGGYTDKTVATGKYERLEDGTYGIEYTYTEGEKKGKKVEAVGSFGIFYQGSSGYYAFYILYADSAYIYLNPVDWTVLHLDGFGTALRYNTDGTVEYGSYTLIDDGLLYFVNDSETDAGVYEFDTEKQEIRLCEFNDMGYYTEEFDSLLFLSYGSVVAEDEWLCYYTVDGEGQVSLYYAPSDVENVADKDINKYGFVKKSFGTFEKQITFGEKTYYRNPGVAITFTRAGNVNEYPLPASNVDKNTSTKDLVFAPGGNGDFDVTGRVFLTMSGIEESIPCTVSRVAGDSGNDEFYVSISMGGTSYLELSITINYKGEDGSTYTVTGLSYVQELRSYTYLQMYELLAQFGYELPNSVGVMALSQAYDKQGKAGGYSLSAAFGESSGFFDAEGNLIESLDNIACQVVEVPGETEADSYVYYEATFKGDDEFVYCLDFQTLYYESLDVDAYYVMLLTREQTLELPGETYKVQVERIIASDSSTYYAPGDIWNIKLLSSEAEGSIPVNYDYYYMYDLTAVFVFGGGIGGDTDRHYIVTLVDGEWTEEFVPAFTDVQLEQKQATVYFTEQGEEVAIYSDGTIAYVDFDPEAGDAFYAAVDTQSESEGVYTVTLYGGAQYKVTVTGSTVTLEEITPSEDA